MVSAGFATPTLLSKLPASTQSLYLSAAVEPALDLLQTWLHQFEGKLPNAYAFALVEHRQQDKIRLRLYLGGEVKRFNTDEIQNCPRLLNMLPVVSEVKKVFFVQKICKISTIAREYVAMRSFSLQPHGGVLELQ